MYSYNPAAPDPTVVCKSYRFCSGLCNARCIPTYGYRRVHAILKRQVLAANHKRVYRVMKVHGLLLSPCLAALSGDTDASPPMSAIAAQTDALSPACLQSPPPHQHW